MGRNPRLVNGDWMVEITDRESAKAWLETQDHQTQVWFAARCALRALPGLRIPGMMRRKAGLAFASLRAILISAAAATCPAAEMTHLHEAANSAACCSGDLRRYFSNVTPPTPPPSPPPHPPSAAVQLLLPPRYCRLLQPAPLLRRLLRRIVGFADHRCNGRNSGAISRSRRAFGRAWEALKQQWDGRRRRLELLG